MACKDFGVEDTKIFTIADLSSKRILPVVGTLEALANVTQQKLDMIKTPKIQDVQGSMTKESFEEIKKELAAARKVVRKGGTKPSAFVIRAQIQLVTGQGLCLFFY